MSQLREVNLQRTTNNTQIKTKKQVNDYEADKAQTLEYINRIASGLQELNNKLAPIANSYQQRKQNGK